MTRPISRCVDMPRGVDMTRLPLFQFLFIFTQVVGCMNIIIELTPSQLPIIFANLLSCSATFSSYFPCCLLCYFLDNVNLLVYALLVIGFISIHMRNKIQKIFCGFIVLIALRKGYIFHLQLDHFRHCTQVTMYLPACFFVGNRYFTSGV